MSDSIKVTWCVSDGYATGSRRPQYVSISHSEISNCETEQELRVLVEGSIQDAFEAKIAPDWEPSEVDRVLELWKELKDEDHRD
jgi:hypothetical protein